MIETALAGDFDLGCSANTRTKQPLVDVLEEEATDSGGGQVEQVVEGDTT